MFGWASGSRLATAGACGGDGRAWLCRWCRRWPRLRSEVPVQIEIGSNDLDPWLPGNGSFGLYNWRQNRSAAIRCRGSRPSRTARRSAIAWSWSRVRRRPNGTLRSGADLRLDNPTEHDHRREHRRARGADPVAAAELVPGRGAERRELPERRHAGRAPERDLEDHQPQRPGQRHRRLGSAQRIAADALADQLLAAAVANSGAIDQSTWSLTHPGRQRADLHRQHAHGPGQGQPEHGRPR